MLTASSALKTAKSSPEAKGVAKMNVRNRSCIRRLSFKALWAARKRNLIAIFAIILTTLLFTSLFTVAMSINSSYQTYTFRQLGGYNHGTFKDVTDEQIAAISKHPKVKAVGERTAIGVISDGVFAKVPAEVSYMDANCTKWSYAEPSVGRMPQSGKEITMDADALRLLGIEPQLGVQVPLTYTVDDKNQHAFQKSDTFTLVGWWEYDDISPVHYINISKEYADSVEAEGIANGMEPFRTDLNVMMASSLDIRGQMEQVDLDLGYTWESFDEPNTVRIGVNWGYTSAQLGESMDATTVLAIAAFLLLVIFTGYLIIYNIFQISVTGDIRFYGLLKTIGVTPRQLRRIIRQQALCLCVAGIPIGLLLGYCVGALLTPVVMARSTYGADVTTISTSAYIFLASALFALATVLLSCSRPGRIAAKVSPVEATKYTEVHHTRKKRRTTRGAKVHQMAFANLGRSKSKTALVVTSLALSVVLLNVLFSFVGGFDMEKYLAKQTCADFIVSSTDYFRFNLSGSYIPQETVDMIKQNTSHTVSGCGYTLKDAHRTVGWLSKDTWKAKVTKYSSSDEAEDRMQLWSRRGDMVASELLIEGLDEDLFSKLTVVEGDLSQMFDPGSRAIALKVAVDDYGNVIEDKYMPKVGDTFTITYIKDAYFIDSRTGEKCNETTPDEYLQYYIADSFDVDYTVCAHVIVPFPMSYRYGALGYSAVLPAQTLMEDSKQEITPLFYLFDTPNAATEEEAEAFLAKLTAGDLSSIMYESKASLRAEFESFRNMFLLLGGVLCAVIGLVGVLNFFNAIMTGILSRRREFAVLQAVGMTSRQLKAMLIYEGLFYTLGAAAAALVLSLLFSLLAGDLLESMFWFFSARFTIAPVLAAAPVFALLGWLIPSIIYGQAAKQSVVERLREAV